MKLNKTHREQIVQSIMRDVPMRHKLTIGERIQDVIDTAIIERGPKLIGALWKDKELGRYLSRSSQNAGYIAGYGGFVSNAPNVSYLYGYEISEQDKKLVGKLIEDHLEELKEREAAEQDLRAALAGVSTRKQLIDQFPEFEKYAPEGITADRRVLAIANVIGALSKMGWAAESRGVAA